MSKKFNIREWVLSVKYWSLLFIPHLSICIIFLIYTLVGASIIQEIESDDSRSTSSSSATETVTDAITTTTAIPNILLKNLERERERLLSKIIDKRQTTDVQQYTKYINKQIREYEEELKKTYKTTSPSPAVVLENPLTKEENSQWSFSGSLYFIGTTLTTIGSNEFTPVSTIGKLFLMIYVAIGIPLTLVFLSDLSLLITRLIKYLSLLLLRIYSTNHFLHIRQWLVFRFIEKHLNISIPIPTDEDDLISPTTNPSGTSSFDYHFHENDSQLTPPTIRQRRLSSHTHHHLVRLRNIYNVLIDTLKDINDDIDLTMSQLLITLFIYILLGGCLIVSNSYFDSVYICFTSLFTINLNDFYENVKTSHDNSRKSLFIFAIYLLFGLAIVALCIKAVQIRIQLILGDIGTKLLRDLVEFLRQMGFHELSTDDILATTDLGSHSSAGSITLDGLSNSRQHPTQRLGRTLSTTSDVSAFSVSRPIGIAEPVRRLSGNLIIRAFKNADGDTNTDKSVQVNTIIRSCGRCAGSTPSPATSMLSVRKHNAVSTTSLSPGEVSSGGDDDETSTSLLQPPNLDRLRQRRATLVAKTIINQMATQPPALSIDEQIPSLTLANAQRGRTSEQPSPSSSSSVSYKYAAKKASSPPLLPPPPPPPPTVDTPRKRGVSQEEFLEISKQISSLLTPSDDEN